MQQNIIILHFHDFSFFIILIFFQNFIKNVEREAQNDSRRRTRKSRKSPEPTYVVVSEVFFVCVFNITFSIFDFIRSFQDLPKIHQERPRPPQEPPKSSPKTTLTTHDGPRRPRSPQLASTLHDSGGESLYWGLLGRSWGLWAGSGCDPGGSWWPSWRSWVARVGGVRIPSGRS